MPRLDGPSMGRGEDAVGAALAFLADAGMTPEQASQACGALAGGLQAAVMDLGRAAQIAARAFQSFNAAAAAMGGALALAGEQDGEGV